MKEETRERERGHEKKQGWRKRQGNQKKLHRRETELFEDSRQRLESRDFMKGPQLHV